MTHEYWLKKKHEWAKQIGVFRNEETKTINGDAWLVLCDFFDEWNKLEPKKESEFTDVKFNVELQIFKETYESVRRKYMLKDHKVLMTMDEW